LDRYRITPARPSDLPRLPAIELAAARLLAGHAPDSVLAETTGLAELEAAQRDGHLWVALAGEAPVGFAHVKVLEPATAHLHEIDALPDHGRRGFGTRLVRAVYAWAAAPGFQAVSRRGPSSLPPGTGGDHAQRLRQTHSVRAGSPLGEHSALLPCRAAGANGTSIEAADQCH